MNEYAYRGMDGDGKPIRVRSVGDAPEQVLAEARAGRHHVVMLYKLLPTEVRYEPLLAAANFPLPHTLSKSVFRRFDRRAGPAMLCYGGEAWTVLRAASSVESRSTRDACTRTPGLHRHGRNFSDHAAAGQRAKHASVRTGAIHALRKDAPDGCW